MQEPINDSHLNLFRSLFKGREDVFAIHWTNGAKSGYMPAYFYDPYRYKAHKIKGGTFQSFTEKTYLPLTDEQLIKHLNGEQQIGVYPLLPDNTSWFIAADFDEKNWIADSQKFLACCRDKNIPAYIERSRSGKGCHVWIFFENPYPASKSRIIVLALLTEAGVISSFDKNSSFDRLFPNQDMLSGKGLGNLIAVPFYKPALEKGNSCFIDSNNMEPDSDQWAYLEKIQRISIYKLNEIHQLYSNPETANNLLVQETENSNLTISLSNIIRINKSAMPGPLVNFLKEELNFINTEFIIKKNSGKNTFGTERYFRFIEEFENEVQLPKGFAGRLLRFCKESGITFYFKDQRKKRESIGFKFQAVLKDFQEASILAASKKDMGVIVAPPGSGKTVMALKLISEKQQPALIVVHRKQLMDQWIERIEAFLGISKQEIGKIGQGKAKIGKQVTVATIQSLAKEMTKPDNDEFKNVFGTIIIDECHHIAAKNYRNTIQLFNSYYIYGLTATPFRKYNDGKLIFIHLGEVISSLTPQQTDNPRQVSVVIRNTELDIPFNGKTDKFETLSKVLVHDSARNKQILHDITNELNSGKKVIVLTERREHIEALHQFLKQSYEVIALSGEDSEKARKSKWEILHAGNYQVLITTGQFFGEGTDLRTASCLFIVYPFSFEGKLIQYIGRVQRSEITPVIYDYRDIKIDYLNKLFLKRNTYYRKMLTQSSLFDDPSELVTGKEECKIITIDKKIKIALELLEFRYGSIAFTYLVDEINMNIEFEIIHDFFRPEFTVLKPYFAKVLKSKLIDVSVFAEIENGILISQMVSSDSIQKITREVIESIRFQFITKSAFVRPNIPLQDVDSQTELILTEHLLYDSNEELLQDLLKHAEFKHHRHLHFLAEKHAGHLLKIRFVLQPFSFVFLIEGFEQFHIILETLDTEEATYLWHFSKNITDLPAQLKEIDQDLGIIRRKGRQVFLSSPPENFSRIIHEYADPKKGFIIWMDLLEEQLT